MSVQENPDEVFTVMWKSGHSVWIPSDSKSCGIRAICVLSNGQVLLADMENKKVKLLNQQYKVVSHCNVTAGPHGICQITPREVAVTVDDDINTHEVQFITVTKSMLVTERQFRLEHKCRGIAHHADDLFIGAGSALYMYSLSGELCTRLYKQLNRRLTTYRQLKVGNMLVTGR
ncbi:hypothetical protein DPMN_093003 [Dreissena polymorpha]|uniref:Uncharacterized protein n=1 Tax=Dreissena polymorpha TaxID=45954 RepID=A0A9D4L2T2_DREPO|nr:hypothetical protein DPMN_093003 [Dreissena polymorpha]